MPLALGDIAPNFTLPELSGHEVSLTDFRGRKVILYMWASW
jgi:peroxiredoxin